MAETSTCPGNITANHDPTPSSGCSINNNNNYHDNREEIVEENPQEKENSNDTMNYRVLALYKFVSPPFTKSELEKLQMEIDMVGRTAKARGNILLAPEGINGTICYPYNGVLKKHHDGGDDDDDDDGRDNDSQNQQQQNNADDLILTYLKQNQSRFGNVRTRISYCPNQIFHRYKVKLKNEIVTIGIDTTGTDTANTNDSTHDHDNKQQYQQQPNDGMISTIKGDEEQTNVVVDPTKIVGTYVKPGPEWDALLEDPDVLVIDTRNNYEVDIGTFQNAINPNTTNFREFPMWLEKQQQNEQDEEHKQYALSNATATASIRTSTCEKRRPKAVAMFCTGGIRCEKATSYALSQQFWKQSKEKGLEENEDKASCHSHEEDHQQSSSSVSPSVPIYHLEGGILAYLDSVPPNKSKFNGECYVFDQRVAVTHGLKPTSQYDMCFACRKPLSKQNDMTTHPDFVEGICCKHCKHEMTPKQKQRFQERQKQIRLMSKSKPHIYDPKENIVAQTS